MDHFHHPNTPLGAHLQVIPSPILGLGNHWSFSEIIFSPFLELYIMRIMQYISSCPSGCQSPHLPALSVLGSLGLGGRHCECYIFAFWILLYSFKQCWFTFQACNYVTWHQLDYFRTSFKVLLGLLSTSNLATLLRRVSSQCPCHYSGTTAAPSFVRMWTILLPSLPSLFFLCP